LSLHIALMEKLYAQDVDHISEDIPKSVDGQIEIRIDPILHTPSVKIHFTLEFQVISNTFLLIS
jgi:hypothetical protein